MKRRAALGCAPVNIERSERGTAALEFAIVIPFLVLLVFGIIEFGAAFNRTQGLNAAAREGGRAASVGGSFTAIQTAIFNAQSLFTASDITVSTIPATSGAQAPCQIAGIGNTVTIKASVPTSAPGAANYAIDVPFFGNFKLPYSASATYRCERTG